MNSSLLNERRRMKNYSVSRRSGLPWWWQNRELFWWMKVGWKTLCPLIKGPYSQEAKEVLGPMPRSPWPQFTTRWCFLIHVKVPLLHGTWGGKEKLWQNEWCRGTAGLLSALTFPCPTPEQRWHPALCEWLGTMRFGAKHLKMCPREDDAWKVDFE